MNNLRKKRIEEVIETLMCMIDELSEIRDEEQEARGDIPKQPQKGEHDEAASDIADDLSIILTEINILAYELKCLIAP